LVFVKYAGLGRHIMAVGRVKTIVFAKVELVTVFTYIPAVCLPKLVILSLYLRIFVIKFYRIAAYTIGAFVITVALVSWGFAFRTCQPLAYRWNKSIPGGHFLDQEQLFVWASIPNIITDVAMI
ncbi:hypothetical protein B0J14DRAFT_434400, partial [Halenospora varia]